MRKYVADDLQGEYQMWCNGRRERDYTEDVERQREKEKGVGKTTENWDVLRSETIEDRFGDMHLIEIKKGQNNRRRARVG